jgi:hypothetical protein
MDMKKIFWTALFLAVALGAQADGRRWHRHGHGHQPHGGTRFSFYWGGYPGGSYYSPWRSYSYYPEYSYGYDYAYTRPNYAVNGLLGGALLGGLIGHSVNHQGWEGAGIGAAAGLVLGGLAESNARRYELNSYGTPAISYSYTQPAVIDTAPVINTAPTIPDAPQVQRAPTYRPASAMSSANSLFGR